MLWKNHEPVLTSAEVLWWQVEAKLMRPFLVLSDLPTNPSHEYYEKAKREDTER